MKATIFKHVPAQAVPDRVTPEYRTAVDLRVLDHSSLYTVVNFPGKQGESPAIVTSKTLGKALDRLGTTDELVVAVAHDFTVEAFALVREIGGFAFAQRGSWHWTDESYARVRDRR